VLVYVNGSEVEVRVVLTVWVVHETRLIVL
jgi:hypothetical protein